MKPRKLSPAEIAERLGVPLQTAYALIRTMPHARLGKHIRVDEKAFEEWFACHCSDAAESGTHGSKSVASGSRKPRTARTSARPKRSTSSASDAPQIRPIAPRTRPRLAS
jgi:excisionase family DNA binding protein